MAKKCVFGRMRAILLDGNGDEKDNALFDDVCFIVKWLCHHACINARHK